MQVTLLQLQKRQLAGPPSSPPSHWASRAAPAGQHLYDKTLGTEIHSSLPVKTLQARWPATAVTRSASSPTYSGSSQLKTNTDAQLSSASILSCPSTRAALDFHHSLSTCQASCCRHHAADIMYRAPTTDRSNGEYREQMQTGRRTLLGAGKQYMRHLGCIKAHRVGPSSALKPRGKS